MFNLDNLLRENIRNLKPYKSARLEYTGKDAVFLDANENSFGSAIPGNYNRYPDPLQHEIKNKFAELKSDFEIDIDQVQNRATAKTKLLFICSPNNPTGNCFKSNDIHDLVKHFPGLVALDEAYIDFAPEKSWIPVINEFPNLVILQTLSKAWGMAGIRLGMAMANEKIIDVLTKIKPPYNVNGVSQHIALQALQNVADKNRMIGEILAQREWLQNELKKLNFVMKIYPSDGNFLLAKTTDPRGIYQHLLRHGIVVRDRSNQPLCGGCLRITVGAPSENQQLISALATFGTDSQQ